jgi:hypothetical protein
VPGDRGQRDRERFGQFGNRGLAARQTRQNGASGRVGQRAKNSVQPGFIVNHVVNYYAGGALLSSPATKVDEDTRQALIEAKRDGIHPFCVTIDTEARDYLPHMYGAVNWALVEDVKKLPLKVSDIYRRLTT